MCGRYLFWDSENKDIEQLVTYAEERLDLNTFSKLAVHEVTPGSYCFSCIFDHNRFHTGIMKWGFTKTGKTVINARSETCFTSPFFRDAKPCVLPCSGYFEWDASRTKHLITGKEGIQYLGGLYHIENGIPVFVVVTQPADPSVAKIHDRQPLLFDKPNAIAWCRSASKQLFTMSISNRKAEHIKKTVRS